MRCLFVRACMWSMSLRSGSICRIISSKGLQFGQDDLNFAGGSIDDSESEALTRLFTFGGFVSQGWGL